MTELPPCSMFLAERGEAEPRASLLRASPQPSRTTRRLTRMDTPTKTCPSCRHAKPVNSFGRNRCTGDGLNAYCRDCIKLHNRRYRASLLGREAKQRARQIRRQTASGKAEKARANYRHRRRYPEKVQAVNLVTQAIATGRLAPQSCEVCGLAPQRLNGVQVIQAHHDDYSKPLDVRWLCPPHHRRLHHDNRAKVQEGE